MSIKKKFTPAEVEELRANPYTEKVTERQISFTLAFKETFWRLSVEGCTGCASLVMIRKFLALSACIT